MVEVLRRGGTGDTGRGRAAWTALLPLVLLLAFPPLAHWQAVSGWLEPDPIYRTSGLARDVATGPLAGFVSQDPNDGWTTQALGRQATEQWLSGRVPWWNPYSGVGLPLAAEMQCSALFLPFVLLLRIAHGPLLLKLAMQAIAGLASYGLLRALGLARLAALAGGALYELNGTFAWFGDAPMLPVAFLPLLLLGVEEARRAALAGRGGGWAWVAVSLALSLTAGFPETAYIDGLLALAWAGLRLVRLRGRARLAFAAKVAAGGTAGLLLAAPAVLPFLQLLRWGDVGGGHDFADAILPSYGLATLLWPYVTGVRSTAVVFEAGDRFFWLASRLGGYASLAVLLLALASLAGRRERGLRWLLLAWCVLALGRTAGLPGVAPLVNAVPLIALTEFFRYAAPSWELALVVLAAFALDDWPRGALGRRAVLLASATALAAGAAALLAARPLVLGLLERAPGYPWWLWGSLLWGGGVAAATAALLLAAPRRGRGIAPAALLALDALVLFNIPLFSAPRHAALDRDAPRFLSRNLGLHRFHSMGPLLPNYGAYFGLASVNAFYVPTPRRWSDHVAEALDPYAGRQTFGGVYSPWAGARPDPASVLRERVAAYEALGVRYVLASHGADPFADAVLSNAAAAASRAHPLLAGEAFAGTFPAERLRPGRVASVGVLVGTYAGAASGHLAVELCAGGACRHGTAALAGAADNAVLDVPLDAPLDVSPGAAPRYRILHADGERAVALWLWPEPGAAPGGLAPRVALTYAGPGAGPGAGSGPRPARVYADALVDIYELPRPAPYWEVRDGGPCALAPAGREALAADCTGPALLARRELAYPGWHAAVDGAEVAVEETPPLFQAVRLPPGRSEVRFRYWPPYIGWAYAAALLGLATAAGCWPGRRPSAKRR